METQPLLVLKVLLFLCIMGVQRKFRSRSKPIRQRSTKSSKMNSALKRLNQRMSKIVGTIESKSGVQKYSYGLELGHNSLVMFSNNLLFTANGTTDNESSFGTLIGDKLTLRNLAVKGMIELNER